MKLRTMSVSGSFYPSSAGEIVAMIDRFNAIVAEHPEIEERYNALTGRAVIVPHAGWVYSGFTANIAHRILAQSGIDTLLVIGPSHRVGFEGASLCTYEHYQTPLGELNMDTALIDALRGKFSLACLPEAHREHSTEVQMPFIKHYLPHVRIAELVYGHAHPSAIAPVIEYVLGVKNSGVVISTDLSHYYTLEHAKRLDAVCLEAIRSENPSLLHRGCEACGIVGVEAMLDVAWRKGLESVLLDYRTSADASGDRSRVVGYASALFRGV